MDAVEASHVGRALAWMASEGRSVTIEHKADPRAFGPDWVVAWEVRGSDVLGQGPTLPEAIADALRRSGAGDRPGSHP